MFDVTNELHLVSDSLIKRKSRLGAWAFPVAVVWDLRKRCENTPRSNKWAQLLLFSFFIYSLISFWFIPRWTFPLISDHFSASENGREKKSCVDKKKDWVTRVKGEGKTDCRTKVWSALPAPTSKSWLYQDGMAETKSYGISREDSPNIRLNKKPQKYDNAI